MYIYIFLGTLAGMRGPKELIMFVPIMSLREELQTYLLAYSSCVYKQYDIVDMKTVFILQFYFLGETFTP